MNKREAFEEAFYLFLVGYIVFFWAAGAQWIGMWIGFCLTYGFYEASKATSTKTIKEVQAEVEKVDLPKLKEFVCDAYSYKWNTGEQYPDIRTNTLHYEPKEKYCLDYMRLIYVRNKMKNDEEFARRFLAIENLTPEELHDLKEKHLIPNKFTEEEKQYALYPFWRDEKNFLIGKVLEGERFDKSKEYPKGCYSEITRKPEPVFVFLNEAFKRVNGHDLFE